jgi:hypothetical protein
MYTSLLTARPALKNTGSLVPLSLTGQPQQNFRWKLGLSKKLDILWVVF